MKKMLTFLLLAVLLCVPLTTQAAIEDPCQFNRSTTNIEDPAINGEIYSRYAPAYIRNERTVVPIRFVAEAIGLDVEWDKSDLHNQTAIIYRPNWLPCLPWCYNSLSSEMAIIYRPNLLPCLPWCYR